MSLSSSGIVTLVASICSLPSCFLLGTEAWVSHHTHGMSMRRILRITGEDNSPTIHFRDPINLKLVRFADHQSLLRQKFWCTAPIFLGSVASFVINYALCPYKDLSSGQRVTYAIALSLLDLSLIGGIPVIFGFSTYFMSRIRWMNTPLKASLVSLVKGAALMTATNIKKETQFKVG